MDGERGAGRGSAGPRESRAGGEKRLRRSALPGGWKHSSGGQAEKEVTRPQPSRLLRGEPPATFCHGAAWKRGAPGARAPACAPQPVRPSARIPACAPQPVRPTTSSSDPRAPPSLCSLGPRLAFAVPLLCLRRQVKRPRFPPNLSVRASPLTVALSPRRPGGYLAPAPAVRVGQIGRIRCDWPGGLPLASVPAFPRASLLLLRSLEGLGCCR